MLQICHLQIHVSCLETLLYALGETCSVKSPLLKCVVASPKPFCKLIQVLKISVSDQRS